MLETWSKPQSSEECTPLAAFIGLDFDEITLTRSNQCISSASTSQGYIVCGII
jgi:hypothetical protein